MRIAEHRRRRGMTQAELAAKCGTSQQQVARIERGLTDVRLSTLARMANALGCDVRDLFLSVSEFEEGVNAVVVAKGIDLGEATLAELSGACAEVLGYSCFDPMWERVRVAKGGVVVERKGSSNES